MRKQVRPALCVCVRACVRGCAPVGTLVCVCVCVCPGLWRTWLVSGVGFGLFLGRVSTVASFLCSLGYPMSEQKCLLFNWNVRGLNNKARRKVVKDLAQDYRCTIAALQETKMEVIQAADISETLGVRFIKQFAFFTCSRHSWRSNNCS